MDNMKEVEILLVEDNPQDAELTLRALKKHNFANRVFHVRDGQEALDFLFLQGDYSQRPADKGPKVVILDLKLPRVSGMEVLEAMKNNQCTKTIPVVVLTSSKEEQDIIDSYRLGVNSYIVKPVDFEKFVAAVKGLGMYWLLLNQLPIR